MNAVAELFRHAVAELDQTTATTRSVDSWPSVPGPAGPWSSTTGELSVKAAEPSADVGDADLLRTLFREHSRSVLAYAQRLTGDRFAAEDIVQETFLKVWKNSAMLSEVRSVRGWLLTIAHNIFVDRARARSARPPEVADLPATLTSGGDPAQDVVDNLTVYEAMATLSAEHRAVLVQLHCLGRSVSEAARELGIPEGTVKSRSHHALRAFRRTIGSDQKEPTG
jgi:RNA polymerase sigma-70 factor (ECF subfamily)